MTDDSIYVEIDVDATVDDLWEHSQRPGVHERWDLRFTDITYLPREDGEPQEFTYATRMGGFEVSGTGESVGERRTDGVTTSSLVFRSDDRSSIIREGNGFWKYVERDGGVRFLTEYGYDTRWGALGRIVDRAAFRPLMGWATAWSFDRLRLWIEDGIEPETSLRNALVHAAARLSLAFVLLYQGVVPKLLARHPDELALLADAGLGPDRAASVLTALGVGEALLGLAVLTAWRTRWLLLVAGGVPAALTAGALVGSPEIALGPFNPVALAVALAGLGVAGYVAGGAVPTAANCRRSPSEDR